MYTLFMHLLGFLFFLCDPEYQSKTGKEKAMLDIL